MKRSMTMTFAITALALAVAACGDDDDAATTDTAIAATATNFAFSPDLWTVSSGAEVTLTLTNASDETHEWVLMSTPIADEIGFAEDLVYFELETSAGGVATETFTAPAAGTYQIICAIETHFNSGMEGELIVTG